MDTRWSMGRQQLTHWRTPSSKHWSIRCGGSRSLRDCHRCQGGWRPTTGCMGGRMTETHRALKDLAAIVVHHRSYDTLPTTVRSLLAQGLAAERVIVIDNSEEPAFRDRLAASLPEGVVISYVSNR